MQVPGITRGRRRRWHLIAVAPVLALVAMSAYGAAGLRASSADEASAEDYAGFTRVATTEHYTVVINVLPAEEMFTREEFEKLHPTVGELVVDGRPTPRPPSSRHTEAHIYARSTGLAQSDVRPVLTLIDHTTGRVMPIDATLMQDVLIGPADLHFGSNVVIRSGHEFSIIVSIGSEEVSVDGLLD